MRASIPREGTRLEICTPQGIVTLIDGSMFWTVKQLCLGRHQKPHPGRFWTVDRGQPLAMVDVLKLLFHFFAGFFKSRSRLEAENAILRQQLQVALRRAPARLRLRPADRLIFHLAVPDLAPSP